MGAQPPEQPRDSQGSKRGVMRNLGGFFGGILAGIKADPETTPPPPAARAERSHTETAEGQTEDGRSITLRRTVIEEIEVRDPETDPADDAGVSGRE